MAKKKRPLPTRLTSLLFAGTMGVFFTDPSSAQVGTTRGKLAKGDTEERSIKPVLANQAISGAGTTFKVNRDVVAPIEIPSEPKVSPEKLAASNKAFKGAEHVVVVGTASQTGTAVDYSNKKADFGALGDMKLQDAPFSVMEVKQDVVKNQQVRSLNDEFKYLPSVQLENRGGDGIARPQSRGFEGDVIGNSRFDGLNGIMTTPYASESFQGVTVLNGLAGAVYGPQNPAGMFMFEMKRPTDKFLGNFNFGYDSNSAPMVHLDVGGRGFGKHAKWFGYRINLLDQSGQSYTEGSRMRRDLVQGDFDIHLTKNDVIQLDAMRYTTASYGMPGAFTYIAGPQGMTTSGGKTIKNVISGLPDAPYTAHNRGYGQRNAGYSATTTLGMWKWKHTFNKKWNFEAGGMYENAYRDQFFAANTFTSSSGAYTQKMGTSPTSDDYSAWSNFAYLHGQFKTWKFTHHVNLGSNGYVLTISNPLVTESVNMGGGTLDSSVGLTDRDLRRATKSGSYKSQTIRQQSLFAGDTMDLTKHLSIMGEVSWSWIREQKYDDPNPHEKPIPGQDGAFTTSTMRNIHGEKPIKDNAVFSPMAAVIYKVNPNLMGYFNWGTSVQPGPIAPATATQSGGGAMAPMSSTQYEVGVKWKVNKNFNVNAAAFRMSRPYYLITPDGRYTQGGEQRNQGFEVQLIGKLHRDLSMLAGMTYIDGQVVKATNIGTNQTKLNGKVLSIAHKEAVGVPPFQANILLDYHPHYVKGLGFNANVHYTGRRAADVYNTTYAKSYVTLDLGARYAVQLYKHDFVVRLNVNNVTGERYWSAIFPQSADGIGKGTDTVFAGAPRTWSMTASAFF